mmetsp:Transcript_17085/g.48840  ORF Transcript_17085/g.48840 Transcript_17085/m.48840 type:complete len:362 (-) Transcript_17085:70-1155(-)
MQRKQCRREPHQQHFREPSPGGRFIKSSFFAAATSDTNTSEGSASNASTGSSTAPNTSTGPAHSSKPKPTAIPSSNPSPNNLAQCAEALLGRVPVLARVAAMRRQALDRTRVLHPGQPLRSLQRLVRAVRGQALAEPPVIAGPGRAAARGRHGWRPPRAGRGLRPEHAEAGARLRGALRPGRRAALVLPRAGPPLGRRAAVPLDLAAPRGAQRPGPRRVRGLGSLRLRRRHPGAAGCAGGLRGRGARGPREGRGGAPRGAGGQPDDRLRRRPLPLQGRGPAVGRPQTRPAGAPSGALLAAPAALRIFPAGVSRMKAATRRNALDLRQWSRSAWELLGTVVARIAQLNSSAHHCFPALRLAW